MSGDWRTELLEERVAVLEGAVDQLVQALEPQAPPTVAIVEEDVVEAPRPAPRILPRRPLPVRRSPVLSGGVVLAWGGGVALVLAAAYLVGIGITSGWLTPVRQVLAAAIAGAAMAGGGIFLRSTDRPYAGLLGGAGIVILYLAALGAYAVHGLVSPLMGAGLVALIAVWALILHVAYRSSMYAAFALLGSYAAPLLVNPAVASLADVSLYLLVWNVAYCAISLRQEARYQYVAALYGSLLVYDLLWRLHFPGGDWSLVAGFQAGVFFIFAVQLVLFSRKRPLTVLEAWGHLPAVILFYGVEYALLADHMPRLTPWLAIGFAALLYGVYFAARALSKQPLSSGSVVHTLGSLVLFHAVFIDLLDWEAWPLAGLVSLAAAIAVASRLKEKARLEFLPYLVATGLMYALGLVVLAAAWTSNEVFLDILLAIAYPAVPYAVYALSRNAARVALVAVAHIEALLCIALLVERFLPSEGTTGRLWLSIAWAVFGIALIVLARAKNDRLLARSSLAIFGLFSAKVLLFDLAGADPLVRVGCLAVLGISLYGGGWVYRRIFAAPS